VEWWPLANEGDARGRALRLVEYQRAAGLGERLLQLQEAGGFVGRGGRKEEIGAEVEALLGVWAQGRTSAVAGQRLEDSRELTGRGQSSIRAGAAWARVKLSVFAHCLPRGTWRSPQTRSGAGEGGRS
jgi:hypothetical protein